MPMILFEESGVFNPADYDIKIGDRIHVICVGGGQACNSVITTSTTKDGKTTSFGSYLSASGATDTVYTTKPLTRIEFRYGDFDNYFTRIGGAGGFELGCPVRGGTYVVSGRLDIASDGGILSIIGLSGGAENLQISSNSSTVVNSISINISEYANFSTKGTRGSTSPTSTVYPGNGYGAGGGYGSKNSLTGSGASGVISEKEIVLTSLNSIAITIGAGGVYGAAKGADGCCVIFY